jgi:3-oxoacyl-(acyl-carrier-protein) synthase
VNLARGRRAAITGIGLVTPLGNDTASTWRALLEGRTGAGGIRSFDASGFTTRIAAEVKGFDDARGTGIDGKLLKFAMRSHRFALAAADEALRDAGVRPEGRDAERWGCVTGAGMMGLEFASLLRFQREHAPEGVLDETRLLELAGARADPMELARSQPNAGLALLCRAFGIRGYSSCVHTACSSGGQAVGTALKLIRRGTSDRVLAGGYDSMVNPVGLASFCLLGALSTDNDEPGFASRPFDRTRNGFVLGEGAGFLVIEEWEAARRRGARIYAELAGDGNSLSAYRITDSHPSGDGPIQAMREALRDAGARPEDVDYLNAHGTSTAMNDRSECAAVRAVFGGEADRLLVSSTKSLMGHLIAAAGAVEAAVSALAIRDGTAPASANLREPDPECDLRFITGPPMRGRIRMALSNSFGFGGSNSSILLRHPEETP